MNQIPKKELGVFLIVISVIIATFVAGIFYIRAHATVTSGDASLIASSTTDKDSAAISTSSIAEVSDLATSTMVESSPSSTASGTVSAKATTSTPPAPPSPPSPVITPVASQPSSAAASELFPYSIGVFNNQFTNSDGWSKWWWGKISQTNGFLVIGATATGTSGGDIFDGGTDWTDYTFQTLLDWNAGETFGLMARYSDDKNYLECEYSEQTVGTIQLKFEQFINGKETVLAVGNVQNYNEAGGADINAAIRVEGNEGDCAFNYQAISTYVAGNTITGPLEGGIGFETWDPNKNNSQITVKSISVTSSTYDLGPNTIQGIY